MALKLSKRWRRILLGLALVVAALGGMGWYHLLREVPTEFASDVEHFKYGSVGVEAANGVPYWIWYVLPLIFEDKLPVSNAAALGDVRERYTAAFGFIWEEGQEAPIGLPVKTVGFSRLGINCGLCHTATMRTAAGETPTLLIGAPSTTFDLQAYLRFLFSAAADPRFSARSIMPRIEAVHDPSFVEGLLYRFLIIPQMKKTLLEQREQLGWMTDNPDWGPGRADPFNPAKIQILELPYDGTIGSSDIVPLWNWRIREGAGLHWDGLNTSLTEIFLNSGIGNGASAKTIDLESLDRTQRWIMDLPPAPYPFPVDAELASSGQVIFDGQCASCHGVGGDRMGQPIPLAELGTDGHRLDSWTTTARDAFLGLDEYDWRYEHFRKTDGYVAVPLDGIWARAPYLHNGSVPTLEALLAPPESRPKAFYRGYDVFEPDGVGFVSSGPSAEREGFLLDTSLRGNSNAGHLWGTELTADEKRALVEYLKTL